MHVDGKTWYLSQIYSEFGIERRDTAIFSSTGVHIMDGIVMIDVALQRKVF